MQSRGWINPLVISVGRKLKHLLELFGVLFLLQVVRLLPPSCFFALGRALGRFTFSLLRIRRQVALQNLQQAFPEKTAGEIFDIGKSCYKHFGMMMLECLRMQTMAREELLALIEPAGGVVESELDRLQRENTGAILLTAHFGNWEYLGVWVAAKGYPVSFINQPQNNPHVDRLIQRTREGMGAHMIARGSMGLRLILRALRERRFVFILPDQDAGRDGIFVPFFGRPASTARGAAAFALKSAVPIVICMLSRQTNGRYSLMTERLSFDFSPGGDENAKITEITRRYTAAMETHIRRCPEQWLWLHRRWKNQPQRAEAHAKLHA